MKKLNKNPDLLLVRDPKIYEIAEKSSIEETKEKGKKEGTKKLLGKCLMMEHQLI